MYCKNCGKELKNNEKVCPDCKTNIEHFNKTNNNGIINDTFLCILSLVFMYGRHFLVLAYILNVIKIDIFSGCRTWLSYLLGPIIAWIIIIYTKVRFKDSKFAKVLLIIYGIQTALTIAFITWFSLTCEGLPSSFGFILN